MSVLSSIKFASVPVKANKGNPSASVRSNGQFVFNEEANKIVGVSKEKNLFRVGTDESGKIIYLVPAKDGDDNVIKATKNGDAFLFRQTDFFKSINATGKYVVSSAVDEDVADGESPIVYFVLTPEEKVAATETPAAV